MLGLKVIAENWVFLSIDQKFTGKAAVPGCIHADLQNNGLIEYPYYRDSEKNVEWISHSDWEYCCEIEIIPEEMEQYKNFMLRFEGIDTLSEIFLNGYLLGVTDNMHRIWDYDISQSITTGINSLKVILHSPVKECEKRQKQFPLSSNCYSSLSPEGKSHLRKEMANFGWDWGPCLITSGIWRPVKLLMWNTARITDVKIDQVHSSDSVSINTRVKTDVGSPALRYRVSVSDDKMRKAIEGVTGERLSIAIENPELWWPVGMGMQHLYLVEIELLDENGDVLDRQERQIGLRTVELVQTNDKWGRSFTFAVNGKVIFAKGANWIPPDTFASNVTEEWRKNLLDSALAANMNMVRVWGGGVFEENDFYDYCDQKGLLVWQDLMFACAAYPADDKFIENISSEIRDNVKRIRHHPCICLWCGNNELEQRLYKPGTDWPELPPHEYEKIFDHVIPDLLHENSPEIPYWPCSPHSPTGERSNHNNLDCGDTHLWNVWHKGEPIEWYQDNIPRFCSEFGMQSFPCEPTINRVCMEEDRFINSRVMDYHQRSRIGNASIIKYMSDWLPLGGGWSDFIIKSQVLQGIALQRAIESWRCGMPKCMGTLYWQLNDCWPGPSWSTIDYDLKWKASHYFVKRAFNPLLLAIKPDPVRKIYSVYACNDSPASFTGKAECILTNTAGDVLLSKTIDVSVSSMGVTHITDINVGDRVLGSVLWATLLKDQTIVSENFSILEKPKHLEIKDPELDYSVSANNDSYTIAITAKQNAFWVGISLGEYNLKCSDNYFSVRKDQMRVIEIDLYNEVCLGEIKGLLNVYSLHNMFQ